MTVSEIVEHALELDDNYVRPEHEIVRDLNADSIDVIEILIELEEEFDIEISDDEGLSCVTVGDLVALVERKKT